MLTVYGGVIVKGKEYLNEEILDIDPKQRLLYGIDWKYAGDQFFEESDIVVSGTGLSYSGRKGLNEFLSAYWNGNFVSRRASSSGPASDPRDFVVRGYK